MKTFLRYYIFKTYKMGHKTSFLLNPTETEVKEISSLYQKWVFRTRLMKRKKNTLSPHNISQFFSNLSPFKSP